MKSSYTENIYEVSLQFNLGVSYAYFIDLSELHHLLGKVVYVFDSKDIELDDRG